MINFNSQIEQIISENKINIKQNFNLILKKWTEQFELLINSKYSETEKLKFQFLLSSHCPLYKESEVLNENLDSHIQKDIKETYIKILKEL